MQEEKGRNLIILATTLILLAGSLRLYIDNTNAAAAPGAVVTEAEAARRCDQQAIQLSDRRLGCQNYHHSMDRRMVGTGNSLSMGGTAKFISMRN